MFYCRNNEKTNQYPHRMKNMIAILITIISCISCTNEKNQVKEQFQSEVIKVDFGKEYTQLKFPNTNYSMTIQRLEDNEEYPIGHIDKLIVDNEKIYTMDSFKAKSIFVYSRDGKLLHVIKGRGDGPGEFHIPQDFEIDKETGNMIVMDMSSGKFIFYSPEGEYIKEFRYDSLATGFILDNDNNIIMDNGNIPFNDSNYYLRRIDQKGNFLSHYFPSDTSTIGITLNPRISLQRSDNNLFFLPTLSNCIYALDNEDYRLVYQIDFGKDWPSEDFFENAKSTHPLKIREQMFEHEYVCFLNYAQTKDILYLEFHKGKNYSFYYNKKTKQSLLISIEDENISFPLATYGEDFIFVKYNETTGEPTLFFYKVDFDLQ